MEHSDGVTSRSWLRTGAFALAGGAAVLAAAQLLQKAAQRRRQQKQLDPSTDRQLPWPEIRGEVPGKGAPLFHGVRVVELATVYAAPSAGRTLADLGAEVVKVEVGAGDPVRTMLLRFQGARRNARNVSQTGEVLLAGKRSVVLDAKVSAQLCGHAAALLLRF